MCNIIMYIFTRVVNRTGTRRRVLVERARRVCVLDLCGSLFKERRKRPSLLIVGHVDDDDDDDRRLCARRDRRLPRRRYEISQRDRRGGTLGARRGHYSHGTQCVAWLVPLPRVAFLRPVRLSLERKIRLARARASERACRGVVVLSF